MKVNKLKLACIIGMMVLGISGCGLFGDGKDSMPDVETAQMETEDPDKPKPDRDE